VDFKPQLRKAFIGTNFSLKNQELAKWPPNSTGKTRSIWKAI
jgi:hypothetical protein